MTTPDEPTAPWDAPHPIALVVDDGGDKIVAACLRCGWHSEPVFNPYLETMAEAAQAHRDSAEGQP